jgi:hypothetical protein
VVTSIPGATGERRRFGHDPPSVTGATDGCRHLTMPPGPSLSCGMANRSSLGVARGSSRIVPVRPVLLETRVPMYSL